MGKIEKEILGFWKHEFKKSHKLNWWKLKTFAPQNLPLKKEEKYIYITCKAYIRTLNITRLWGNANYKLKENH